MKHLRLFFLAVAMLSLQTTQAADVKLGGFVDAQYRNRAFTSVTENNSIVVNDGALYLSKEMDNGEVMIDLPFRGGSSSTTNTTTGVITQNANFTFASSKAQAFVGYKYSNGLKWRFGQYDAIYGFEGNDTKDIAWTQRGLTSSFLPNVHTGLLASYDLTKESAFSAMVANQRDAGVMASLKPNWGFKLTYNPSFRSSLGVLIQDKATGEQNLYDFLIGSNFGALAVDLQFDVKKLSAKTGWSGMLNGIYGVTDIINFGTRIEIAKKMTAFINESQVTVGPQFKMTKDLTGKLDFSTRSQKNADGVTTTQKSTAIAAVYAF